MASYTSNIPLLCSICPRQPKFSDVSHLLTHIASKGHLAHYYKLQIRAASEADAREEIDSYNTWYTEWGIEHLMSDRMNLKDKRRTRTRASNARARQTPNPANDSLRRKAANAYALDPRLADQLVKDEPSPSQSPKFPDRLYPPPAFAPKQHAWPSPFSHSTVSSSNPGLMEGSDIFTEKSEPCSRAVTPPVTAPSTAPSFHADKDDDEVVDTTIVSEASRLKGIYWPGMDIFDSATPEMKRKRNQKKDVSVVEQLEYNSREVEATEHIWTPCGTLRKERPISGSVTDSSPVKFDGSPSIDYQVRPPLLELVPNIRESSRQQSRASTRTRRRSPRKRNDNDLILEDELDLQRAMGQDPDLEEQFTGAFRKRRRPAFDVFKQDDDEPFGRSTNMAMLTSEFNHPSQQEELPSPSRPSQQRLDEIQQQPEQLQPQMDRVHQQTGQSQHHLGQTLLQQECYQGLDFNPYNHGVNAIYPAYDNISTPLAFQQQTPTFFESGVALMGQPFQAFQPQTELNGLLGPGFPNTNYWVNNSAFLASGMAGLEDAGPKAQPKAEDGHAFSVPTTPKD
ncbi:type-2 protein geranylgeranyltransferase subunit beta protein [Diplodia corticola]|uniref:Type-2 protein geranylgeranyltransferase subunit beta protein n=1 Tax=Diplodia corticola TaxID=236234 RepID=A0A1J9QQ86_9PEZI|nr:type-2 protein geranylgeranyltransferase subunit beta protein [Diplodia corticola]OJD31086.1 type-2 protein geranylgeranyltransferase subunit beta protein [Diplodia corticola]